MSLLDTASLIVTPNGYKEGKLYSVIPSDGSGDLSVTRATTATRVNSAGLVELVPYNLVQYSEQLNDSSWNKLNVTITPNTTIAPDGTLTADTMTNSSTGYGLWQQVSVAPSTQYTFSFYVKKGTNTSYIISVIDAVSFADIATLDYSSQVGTDWVRVSTTFTTLSTTSFIRVYQMRDGSSTGTAFLWGAQLNEGTIKPYQKTETRLNIPRLDYSNGTCPSILVEPQRTNLATWSNDFSNAVWTKNQSTITSNYAVSPQGIQNASRWLSNSGATLHFLSQLYGFTLGQTYTISCYVKSNTSSNQDFRLGIDGNVTSSNLTATTEWQRFTFTASPVSAVGLTAFFISRPSTNAAVDLLIYGLQLEVGAYATSYIPTTSASVTRNADAISKTGATDLIGQTEGTLYMQVGKIQTPQSVLQLFGIDNGTSAQRIEIGVSTSNQIFIYAETTSGSVFQLNIGTLIDNSKIAVAYKANQWAVYLNGTSIYTNTSANYVPTCSALRVVGRYDNAGIEKANVKSTAIYKTRLTNAELATLTTI